MYPKKTQSIREKTPNCCQLTANLTKPGQLLHKKSPPPQFLPQNCTKPPNSYQPRPPPPRPQPYQIIPCKPVCVCAVHFASNVLNPIVYLTKLAAIALHVDTCFSLGNIGTSEPYWHMSVRPAEYVASFFQQGILASIRHFRDTRREASVSPRAGGRISL